MHDFNVTRARATNTTCIWYVLFFTKRSTRRFITTIAITLRAFIGGHFTTPPHVNVFFLHPHEKQTNCHKCMLRWRRRNNRNPSLIIQPKTTLSKHCAAAVACVKCDAQIFQYLYAHCSRYSFITLIAHLSALSLNIDRGAPQIIQPHQSAAAAAAYTLRFINFSSSDFHNLLKWHSAKYNFFFGWHTRTHVWVYIST